MATYYWVGGTGTWNAAITTNWATSSGGAGSAGVPTSADSVIIDTSSGTGTITCTAGVCLDLTVTATQAIILGAASSTLSVYGNLSFPSGGSFSASTNSNTITFASTTTGKTVTTNGKALSNTNFNGIGGAWALQDNLISSGTMTLTTGTFNANNKNVTVVSFDSTNVNTRTVTMGSGTWTLSGTGNVWYIVLSTNLTINVNTANIVLSDTSTAARTFACTIAAWNTITIGGATGSSTTTINLDTGSSIATLTSTKTVAHTITFSNASPTIIGNWAVTGTVGNVVTINSSTVGTQRTITYTGSSRISMNYMSIRDINFNYTLGASNPYLVYAGANSTNGGNNSGIAFVDVVQTAYLLTTGTSWTVPTDWNSRYNIIHLIGAGGGGASSVVSGNNRAGGGGGGGGGYRVLTNQSLTPGASIPYTIGTSAIGSAGGSTTFNTVNTAGGGGAGTATTTPTSTGGVGGTGTFAGGAGGAGATTTVGSPLGVGGGGAGGAGGPNGVGGNGGTGFGSTVQAQIAGGGGGGNGGGGNGVNATSAQGGAGGNNASGTGSGAGASTGNGTAGTFGGGGGGGINAGGSGGSGIDIANTIGGAGGAGGTGSSTAPTNIGVYGGGGGGAAVTQFGGFSSGGAGSQGAIFIVYQPITLTIGQGWSMGPGFAIS
jgi:hypothetical protein